MKSEPRIWNRRDTHCPADAVYVGRPTKWGNPWSHLRSHDLAVTLVHSREDAIERFLLWITSDTPTTNRLRDDIVRELRGKDLCCWCSPQPCHADILLQIAND